MKFQLKRWPVILILTAFVGGMALLLNNYNNKALNNQIEKQTINKQRPTLSPPKVSSNIIRKTISEIPAAFTSETNGSESTPERERSIKMAMLQINSKDVEIRLQGIQDLAAIDPEATVRVLYDALARIQNEPDIEGMIILGALKLAHNETVFPNEEIHYIYETTDNDNIKGRLARILSYRGDDRVLESYLENIKPKLSQSNTEGRRDMLYMLGSIESKLSISYITPYLSDPDEGIRIAALTAFSFSANESEIQVIKPLLLDASSKVRHNAAIVLNYLLEKGDKMPLPDDIQKVTHSNI